MMLCAASRDAESRVGFWRPRHAQRCAHKRRDICDRRERPSIEANRVCENRGEVLTPYGKSRAKIAKPSARSQCQRLCLVPITCRLPGKHRGVVEPAVGERSHTLCPPHAQGPRPPVRPEIIEALPGLFGAVGCLRYSAVSALESASPAGNTPSRPSRRGYSTTRTCSRLRRNCTARLCGGPARSSHRGGHSLLPRKLRATPVMSNNQDPSLERWLQEI